MARALRDLPLQDAPQEKALRNGIDTLTDSELLALILRTGSRGENVVALCQRIMQGGIMCLIKKSFHELLHIHGIGPTKAIQLRVLGEIARRIDQVKIIPQLKITSSDQVAQYYMKKLHGKMQEHFMVVFLDARNKVICEREISRGTVNAALIHPREIFREAVRVSATSLILVHNHPTGDPTPSQEDIHITREIIRASEFMHIQLLDHIVIGKKSYASVLDII